MYEIGNLRLHCNMNRRCLIVQPRLGDNFNLLQNNLAPLERRSVLMMLIRIMLMLILTVTLTLLLLLMLIMLLLLNIAETVAADADDMGADTALTR